MNKKYAVLFYFALTKVLYIVGHEKILGLVNTIQHVPKIVLETC